MTTSTAMHVIQPAEFVALVDDARRQNADEWSRKAALIHLMLDTLDSNGFGAGVDAIGEAFGVKTR